MNNRKLIKFLFLNFIFGITLSGCYHNLQPVELEIEKEGSNFSISSASKCHVIDGSVIVFQDGFSVSSNRISGIGKRYYFTGMRKYQVIKSIPLDSIIAITTYEDYTGARTIANGNLSLFGVALSGITAYCLTCPKCCFGSCPTVYTFDEDKSYLETELYSSSISRMLEDDDLDKLIQKIPDDGNYEIKITNEALETHYTDKLNLILAEHPSGSVIYPDIKKELTLISNPGPVESAFNSEGVDILYKINSEDTIFYRSGMKMAGELKNDPKYDWIEFSSEVTGNTSNAKLLVRYRNTLLSTILFYDVVLGSQGIQAIRWNERMNNDSAYAEDFKMIYDNFSGMQLEIFQNSAWIKAGKFPDAGPITWKYTAAEIPINGMNEIKVRLKFIPDNFMIDYIGIEYEGYDKSNITTKILNPAGMKSNISDLKETDYSVLENADGNYLITNPGDSYSLNYKITKRTDTEQSLLISSRGYYNEWIRGSWIKNDSSVCEFDLYDIKRNLKQLAESWETNRVLIESEFFNARIPLKEK